MGSVQGGDREKNIGDAVRRRDDGRDGRLRRERRRGRGKGPFVAAPVSDARRMSESLALLKGYRSLGMKGEFRGDMMRTVDLHPDRQGNCVGTYTEPGTTTRLITTKVVVIGDRGWAAYDDAGLERTLSFAKSFAPDKVAAVEEAVKNARGKYVEYSAREMLQFPSLILCSPDQAFAGVPGKVSSAEEVGNPRTRAGERLVQLTHGSGGGEVSVHVPERGGSVPRGIDFSFGDAPVLLELDDYDEPVQVQQPSRADIVRAEEVQGLDLASG
ncbi:hypothetical protein P8A22_26140 [Streptomyces laculatispora]|uniref:Uncharacterized protein n=1 Tax=Streptomyces laculatispora TaxID=887464 RepID=A0ABY9I8C2_9ACTN|nr:hypothetical protein [Streptomyces laculatispora]WLQ43100.1 hypothetical protein P8A22_26140 [Streptomyces laculatispora]